jgi:hypothetical protein
VRSSDVRIAIEQRTIIQPPDVNIIPSIASRSNHIRVPHGHIFDKNDSAEVAALVLNQFGVSSRQKCQNVTLAPVSVSLSGCCYVFLRLSSSQTNHSSPQSIPSARSLRPTSPTVDDLPARDCFFFHTTNMGSSLDVAPEPSKFVRSLAHVKRLLIISRSALKNRPTQLLLSARHTLHLIQQNLRALLACGKCSASLQRFLLRSMRE